MDSGVHFSEIRSTNSRLELSLPLPENSSKEPTVTDDSDPKRL